MFNMVGNSKVRFLYVADHMSLVVRKPAFCICENKDADQLRGNAMLISAFVFATRIVQSLYYLYPKLQASSHLLWLYRPVCVRPGRKPRRRVSQNEAHIVCPIFLMNVFFVQKKFRFIHMYPISSEYVHILFSTFCLFLGTTVVTAIVFWLSNLLFISLDLLGFPSFLLKYKVQDEKQVQLRVIK